MARRNPIILALIYLVLFSTCKKGEDDPAVSLRSRTGRLAGEWRFLEGSLTIGTTNITKSTRYNASFQFRDGRYTLTETGGPALAVASSGIYILSLNLDKKGNVKMNELLDTRKLVAEGNWDFNNGKGSEKKKESLLIYLKNVSQGSTGGYNFFNQGGTDFRYHIKELRHKKLVLVSEHPVYIDADGAKQTFYGEFTFIQ